MPDCPLHPSHVFICLYSCCYICLCIYLCVCLYIKKHYLHKACIVFNTYLTNSILIWGMTQLKTVMVMTDPVQYLEFKKPGFQGL